HRVHARAQLYDYLPRRTLPEYRPFAFPQSHALDRLRQRLLLIVQFRRATAAVPGHGYLPALARPSLSPEAARVDRAPDVLISSCHRDRSERAPALNLSPSNAYRLSPFLFVRFQGRHGFCRAPLAVD